MLQWCAWYTGGRVYRSGDMAWGVLPPEGCLLVKVWPETGPPVLWGGADAVVMTPTGPRGVDLPLPEFEAVAAPLAAAGLLKYGQLVPDAAYEAVWRDAVTQESP